jgi:putative endonuclease
MTLGRHGEDLALEHYRQLGFKFLERNYIFHRGKQTGEIDLVVCKNQEIVFVEVKTRRSSRFGTGLEAVDFFKQRKLVMTAKLYLLKHPQYRGWNYRIDVVTVDIDNQIEPVIIVTNAIEDLD